MPSRLTRQLSYATSGLQNTHLPGLSESPAATSFSSTILRHSLCFSKISAMIMMSSRQALTCGSHSGPSMINDPLKGSLRFGKAVWHAPELDQSQFQHGEGGDRPRFLYQWYLVIRDLEVKRRDIPRLAHLTQDVLHVRQGTCVWLCDCVNHLISALQGRLVEASPRLSFGE